MCLSAVNVEKCLSCTLPSDLDFQVTLQQQEELCCERGSVAQQMRSRRQILLAPAATYEDVLAIPAQSRMDILGWGAAICRNLSLGDQFTLHCPL